MLLGPRVDGQFLPAEPEYLMKEGRHKRVDLISGVTQHDGAIFSLSKSWVMLGAGLLGDRQRVGQQPLGNKWRHDKRLGS